MHVLGQDQDADARPACLLPARVRRDLGAVQRHHPNLDHPCLGVQSQRLREDQRERVLVLPEEPGDRGVIGHQVGADIPTGHVDLAQLLDTPRGLHLLTRAIQRERQQHVRVVGRPPLAVVRMAHMQQRGIDRVDHLNDQMRQMTSWQPLPQIRRQQEPLIPITPHIRKRHAPIVTRGPRQAVDIATGSQRAGSSANELSPGAVP